MTELSSQSGPASVVLKRRYVAGAWHGQRVAQALMDAALDAGERPRCPDLVARGMGTEPAGSGPLHKYGFTRVGGHTFVLVADAQTDWLLARPLGAPRRRGSSESAPHLLDYRLLPLFSRRQQRHWGAPLERLLLHRMFARHE
jgi:hypothetical protein